MKPPRFAYHDPTTRDEALALLAIYADDAKLLAGGQSLVPLLNMRLTQPAHLIDLNRVADLTYIRAVDGGLAIGALTRHRVAEHSALVRPCCPLLAAALPFIGHPPIRSRGTIGGSLAHADPAAELPAVLLALGGHVRVTSQHGSRILPAHELFLDQLQTALTSDELLTEVWFPNAPPRSGVAFVEVSRRHGDYALVGVAAQLTLQHDNAIAAARLALLGVDATPVRPSEAEALLLGEQPTEALFKMVAEQVSAGLNPMTDLHASSDYRRQVAAVLVKRALQAAVQHALQGERDD
ncbi:MAG: xanthine dehydrogenase family protein subunit M [Chloroflexi bacterium]|nr:MAG: xanthine dehydrogenase family protein subunit M [Chloroflexota bacterium]